MYFVGLFRTVRTQLKKVTDVCPFKYLTPQGFFFFSHANKSELRRRSQEFPVGLIRSTFSNLHRLRFLNAKDIEGIFNVKTIMSDSSSKNRG